MLPVIFCIKVPKMYTLIIFQIDYTKLSFKYAYECKIKYYAILMGAN